MMLFLTVFVTVLALVFCHKPCEVTVSAIEGPYYKAGAPYRDDGVICELDKVKNGTQLLVKGRVYDRSCKKGEAAILDVWSADPSGAYFPQTGPDFTCRGKVKTDSKGQYEFLTVVPGRYGSENSYRPAHIHLKISGKDGDGSILTTQLYFENDPWIVKDFCSTAACRAGDPTLTFPLKSESDKSYALTFDIVLGMEDGYLT